MASFLLAPNLHISGPNNPRDKLSGAPCPPSNLWPQARIQQAFPGQALTRPHSIRGLIPPRRSPTFFLPRRSRIFSLGRRRCQVESSSDKIIPCRLKTTVSSMPALPRRRRFFSRRVSAPSWSPPWGRTKNVRPLFHGSAPMYRCTGTSPIAFEHPQTRSTPPASPSLKVTHSFVHAQESGCTIYDSVVGASGIIRTLWLFQAE